MTATGHPNCDRFERHLAELLGLDDESGELSARERTELLSHEAECPRCAGELRSYRATVGLLRSLPRHEAPADFLSWVGRGASARRAHGASFLGARFLRPWGLVAAAVLVCGVLVFFWDAADPPERVDRFSEVQLPLTPFVEEPFFQADVPVPSAGAAVLLTVRLPRDRWQDEVRGLDEKLARLLETRAELEVKNEEAQEVVLTVLPEQLPSLRAQLATWARAREGRLVDEYRKGEFADELTFSAAIRDVAPAPRPAESPAVTADSYSLSATRDDGAAALPARSVPKAQKESKKGRASRRTEVKVSEEALYLQEDEAPAPAGKTADEAVKVRVRILVVPD